MSKSQRTKSRIYRTISAIQITNLYETWSLRISTLRSRKQPPDISCLLLNNHHRRPHGKHAQEPHQPAPHHCCQWIIPSQCWHLLLLVPSKAMILAKVPWCTWSSIQALAVSTRNALWLILIRNLGNLERLKVDRSRKVSTGSKIHQLGKLRNTLP